MSNADWMARGQNVVANTYARYPVALVRGEGCRVWDADGKEYLDFVAGIAVNNLGHCHPKVVAALRQQAGTLLHCSNLYHIAPQIELAEWLCAHSFADKVFFGNSGAEANEAAIKLARKVAQDRHGKERFEIVTALMSFHGRTLGTIAATGQEKVKVGFDPLMPGFRYAPYGDLAAMEAAITPATCAIMLEPLQGEGGVVEPPAGYLQAVRQLCDRNGLLLIFDEIQTGCGRTGTLFAYQHEGVIPDIMTLAKALAGGPPIGAMLAKGAVMDHFGPGNHASTFGGNPLLTATALAAMRTLVEDGILENAVAMGAYFRGELAKIAAEMPCATGVRGRGLLLGLQLDRDGVPLVKAAMEQGLLINCTVGTVLRFLPPLTVTREEIDRALAILRPLLAALN
jgi:acetylornithine aminotransferase